MAISFEIPERLLQEREMLKSVAEGIMRPESRYLDEHEHERPHSFIKAMCTCCAISRRRRCNA